MLTIHPLRFISRAMLCFLLLLMTDVSTTAQTETVPQDKDGTYRASMVTRKAVILTRPQPSYTIEARANNIEGVVRLRAILSASGEIKNIAVLKHLPDGLTERAIEAARRIKFTPAQKDGRAVSQWITIEYHFNIIYGEGDKVDRPAVILEKPEAEYTDEARLKKVTGKVVLRVILKNTGEVDLDSVVRGLPYGLTEKAIEAAGKIVFTPSEDKGRSINQIRTIEYTFSL